MAAGETPSGSTISTRGPSPRPVAPAAGAGSSPTLARAEAEPALARLVADLERRLAASGVGEAVAERSAADRSAARPRARWQHDAGGATKDADAGSTPAGSDSGHVRPAAASVPLPATPRPVPPVEVRIGRLEVRAPAPLAPAAAAPVAAPAPDFSSFAGRRSGTLWRGGR